MASIIFVIAASFSARNLVSSFPVRTTPAANADAATLKTINALTACDERLIACEITGIIPLS
jgi:hypothetical protein